MSELEKDIISVADLLATKSLTIPDYQRPYKWTLKNVVQLFHDIDTHKDKTAYRLGTIVFHSDEKKGELNIVDGQQRTLTLLLAAWALMSVIQEGKKKLVRGDLIKQFEDLQNDVENLLQKQSFASTISHKNLRENYLEIKRIVSRPDFTEQHIDFLLNSCQVVTFTLENISEAFQFFDSQNARGKDLAPHDLLKAYHLREFPDDEQELKSSSVSGWEGLESKQLETLFARYLYRIRKWARGERTYYFGKNQIDVFKGVNLSNTDAYPYTLGLKIVHHYTDEFNGQYQRKVDGQNMHFPFALDQTIINGRRFFEMISYYQQQIELLISKEHGDKPSFMGTELSDSAREILVTLNSSKDYKNRYRTGDKYTRELFDCALIFYWDKFGNAHISRAIEKFFIWAYSLRIKRQSLQIASVDNYVIDEINVFKLISQSISPTQLMELSLSTLSDGDNRNNRSKSNFDTDPLVKLFKEMGHYE
ncbi:TPA: DUF262 domain-containing protein [Candidatus Poribacteria bacterium]|nr:DUF262 domain-containing protein [Candidatus Poribacteria bacterium]|tara:strand:- start:11262 stop:12692 length:1431 start_codon:yes stop_codon:yes gene_type:complete